MTKKSAKPLTESAAKRHVQSLQRAIIDALEDVKAHDINIFDTSEMSPLFERIILASGTSSRQTMALASSVRKKLAEEGFAKAKTEGGSNGEWIIVDCQTIVVHIMQPAIRKYYRLEEIWGEKPLSLKEAKKAKPSKKEAKSKDEDNDDEIFNQELSKPAKPQKIEKSATKKVATKSSKPIVKKAAKPKSTKSKAPLKTLIVKPKKAKE